LARRAPNKDIRFTSFKIRYLKYRLRRQAVNIAFKDWPSTIELERPARGGVEFHGNRNFEAGGLKTEIQSPDPRIKADDLPFVHCLPASNPAIAFHDATLAQDRRSCTSSFASLIAPFPRSLNPPLSDDGDYLVRDSFDIASYVCFPESEYHPTHSLKRLGTFRVALSIPSNLGNPIDRIVSTGKLRDTSLEMAPMPEIPVAEHHHTRRGKDYVGSSR